MENENTEIYHCDKCNICRKGKYWNYLNIVINVMVVLVLYAFNNHNCINNCIEH